MKTYYLIIAALALPLFFSCKDEEPQDYTYRIDEDPELNFTKTRLSKDGDVTEITSTKDVSINYLLGGDFELIDEKQEVVSDKIHIERKDYGWVTVSKVHNTALGTDYKIKIEVKPNDTGVERKVPIYLYCWVSTHKCPYAFYGQPVDTCFIQEK